MMVARDKGEHESIRLLFVLDRPDDPQLYDDLIRFSKGTKRINRLRLLAREGAVAQLGFLATGSVQHRLGARLATVPGGEAIGSSMVVPSAGDVFGEPIVEG